MYNEEYRRQWWANHLSIPLEEVPLEVGLVLLKEEVELTQQEIDHASVLQDEVIAGKFSFRYEDVI